MPELTVEKVNRDLQELKRLIFRKTGASSVGVSGQTIIRNTINNTSIYQASRTYDAIVDSDGQADYTTLQAAIDYVLSIGGGDIFVRAGTYTISSDIATLNKPINIIGVNSALSIINFNSTARNFVSNSDTVYTTGTITSITGTAVVGSSTSWTGNVTAGQYLFVRTKWYQIASVTDNTNLVLAEAFDENFATFPGASYRIATLTRGIGFEGVQIKNSTGTGIALTDVRDINLTDVLFLTNNKGFVFTNCSNLTINSVVVASSTSNGWEMTNCGQLTVRGLASVGNGAVNGVLNTTEKGSFLACNASSGTGDGLNLTSCADLDLNFLANSNGGEGIELIANNNSIVITCAARNNTSDGIKLTATSDYCKIIRSHFDTNGGWGVNIANANCDKNVVMENSFNANVSGTITNSGTSTLYQTATDSDPLNTS